MKEVKTMGEVTTPFKATTGLNVTKLGGTNRAKPRRKSRCKSKSRR